MQSALEAIRQFSALNPACKVTGHAIRRSLKAKAHADALNQGGIVMSRRLQALERERG